MRVSKIIFLFGMIFWTKVFAFLPIQITEKIITSNLETIITTKALTSSVFTNVRREMDIEWAFLQFSPMHIHPSTIYIYLSIIITVIYGQLRFYNGSQIKEDKFKKIEKYAREERIIKNIIFLIILIFIKDIESVS